ncbi:MAG TPA: T9SS type A sorting domain-containing protein [Bacteroidales bacterium]|nr:T9SS type A sorting domain-containing protein [Bacteroidales bacterium]
MKYFLIQIFLFCFIFINGFSQQTFYTHIHDFNEHNPMDMLIKPNGNMLFCSFYRSDDTSWSSVWELDLSGEIINEWTFTNTSEEFLRCCSMSLVNNQIYLFGFGQINEQGNVEEFVSMRKFDLQLNEVDKFEYNLTGMPNSRPFPVSVIYRDSSFHALTAVQYEVFNSTVAYFNISLSGNQFYSAFLPPSSGQKLYPFDFYLVDGSNNLHTMVYDYHHLLGVPGVYTEFDSAMNIISQIPLPDQPFMDFGILKDSDTTFFALQNSVQIQQFNSVVSKFDFQGNILNQFTYECPHDSASWIAYRKALDFLPDGNLIFCTTKNIDYYPGVQLEPTQIRFFKLTPDLELIWQKFLFGDDGNYRVWSIKAHTDGGIVVTGTFSQTPPLSGAMEIFFMKTDSEGLLTHIGDDEQHIKTTEAILYPNPASNFVIVDFSLLYKTATLQLTDLAGRTVFEQALTSNYQQVDISGVPAGAYVYRIYNSKGLEESGKMMVE